MAMSRLSKSEDFEIVLPVFSGSGWGRRPWHDKRRTESHGTVKLGPTQSSICCKVDGRVDEYKERGAHALQHATHRSRSNPRYTERNQDVGAELPWHSYVGHRDCHD